MTGEQLYKKLQGLAVALRKRSRRLPPQFTSIALIAVGALLVLFVGIQYARMSLEQRRLAAEWELQQQQVETGNAKQDTRVADDGLTRLVIPKISLTSFVVEGTNRRSLLLGPGHMRNTAIPGESGNAVITGHRDTFFRHIHELEKGDQFFVQRNGKRFVYEVTGKRIVEPEEVAVTNPTTDAQLTLITCYPTYYIGPAPKRLVIFSKLASEQHLAAGSANNLAPGPHVQTVGATAR